MPFKSNPPTLFVTRLLLFSVLLFPVISTSFTHADTTNPSCERAKPAVTVIPEQDPAGVYWGLRDTVSGKLILDYTFDNISAFTDGFAVVVLSGKYGLIDERGKQIIEPRYDFPQSQLQCGVIAFEYGYGPVVIYDTSGMALMPMVYGMTGLLPCQRRVTYGNIRYGMIDFNRDTILPFKFTNAHLLPEGFCVASKADNTGYNSLYGLYDLNGRQVLPHVFENINGFYSGRAIVKKNGKYGVIDKAGKELFYTEYGRIGHFYNGYTIVYKNNAGGNTTVGIIDKNGREVVPPVYQWLDYVYNFSEGLVPMARDHKYGFLDTNGKVVIPFKYQDVESFKSGIARVRFDWRHTGYINTKGEEIIPPDFEALDQANLARYHSRYIIGSKDSAQHVFDYSGKKVAVLPYHSIGTFNETHFIVSVNNKFGILDSAFRLTVPVEYESLEEIFPGKIVAYKNGKAGFIDLKGKISSPFVYDWIEPVQEHNRLARVGIKGKTGIINSYTRLIVAANYDKIGSFSHGLAVVKRNNKYGYISSKGKELVAPIYDEASPYNGYSASVTLKGETFEIDASGKRLEDEY